MCRSRGVSDGRSDEEQGLIAESDKRDVPERASTRDQDYLTLPLKVWHEKGSVIRSSVGHAKNTQRMANRNE